MAYDLGFNPQLDTNWLNSFGGGGFNVGNYNNALDQAFNISEQPSYSFGFNPQLDASGIGYSPSAVQPTSGFNTGGYSLGGAPSTFNPTSAGLPPIGGPAPATFSPGSSTASATSTLGTPTRPTQPATAPPSGGMGATATPGVSQYRPGSQSTSAPSSQNQQGGFEWSKLLGPVAASGTQALIGGGLGLIGSALASRQSNERDGRAPAPAPRPTPLPTTPTGTPNTGAPTPPLPGAQWSPLLMGQRQPSIADPGGLEAQKRLKRGGQSGGFSLY